MTTEASTADPIAQPDTPPKPFGLGGGLLFFALVAMLFAPLVHLVAGLSPLLFLYSKVAHNIPEIAGLEFKNYVLLGIVWELVIIPITFIAGYTVYSGNRQGRTAAVLSLVIGIIGALLVFSMAPSAVSEGAGTRENNLGAGPSITLLWLVYFAISKRCRNTYNPAYAAFPIREKPLSRFSKRGLIGYGILLFLAALGGTVVTMIRADSVGTEKAGQIAAMQKTHTFAIAGREINIPAPANLMEASTEPNNNDGIVVTLFFSAATPQGPCMYTAGYIEDEDPDWNAIRLTYMKNAQREMLKDMPATGESLSLLGETRDSISFTMQEPGELYGKKGGTVTIVETYMLINRRLARLTTFALVPKVVEKLPELARTWEDQIRAENAK